MSQLGTVRINACAVVGLLLAVGCATTPQQRTFEKTETAFEAAIDRHVTDVPRNARLHAALEELYRLTGEIIARQRDFQTTLEQLHRNYNAPRDQFDALVGEFSAYVSEQRRLAFDQLATIRANMTDSEWEATRLTREEALDAFIQTMKMRP